MQKKFFKEAEEKANAIKYFCDFFETDFSISNRKNFQDLREKYLKYCEEYFTKFKQEDDNNRINIKKAYDYMKNILVNRDKTYQSKSEITKQVLSTYDNLMEAIAGYSFCPRRYNSVGDNQNKTNERVLFEISLLKPMLNMVLENIDAHFEKITDVTKINYFDNQLMLKLEALIEELNETYQELNSAMLTYRDTWDRANGRSYGRFRSYATHSDLGEAKKEWKTAKNNACYTILEFYREMKAINMSLPTEEMVHTIEGANTLFDCGMKNIVSGPNYYCYLSEEERKSIIEENMARKRKLKGIQN